MNIYAQILTLFVQLFLKIFLHTILSNANDFLRDLLMGPGSNSNEEILHTLQISRNGISPSDEI